MRVHLFLLLSSLLFISSTAEAVQCTSNTSFQPGTDDPWSGWGANHANTRFNGAESNPIDSSQLARLELKWAFAFPGVSSVIGNPALTDDRIFIGDENGLFYSIDIESGCIYWTYKAEDGIRTTPLIEYIDNRWTVIFGDRSANVYALDAASGIPLWKVKVEEHQAAILTGAPQYVHLQDQNISDRLFIPVSSSEEGLAAVPTYACCSFQGSVVSLNARNGEILWQSFTIDSKVTETDEGKLGPSGAAIWSAPTIDLDLNRLYVTTGDAYSAPADIATDAVIAMDLLSGEILWVNQGTANDIWTVVCLNPNAPSECGPDQDFGAPGILVSKDNRQFLLSGQKSSIVRAHDRLSGEVLWQSALAKNTTEFGGKIVWGGASDEDTVYFGMGTGVISALALSDGRVKWQTELETPADRENHRGQDGPVTLSHDVLFSGGWDGILRALDTQSGEVIWRYDTAIEFETINEISGTGGSMGAVGQIVKDGYLLVPSGYIGVKNGMTGNVLLVFGLED